MRVAFHVPRAQYIGDGFSGDLAQVRNLVAGLERLGHKVEIVSHVDMRDFYRGKRSAWQLAIEAFAVRRRMRRFAPEAWLVYCPDATHPDMFGWWMGPKPYILFGTMAGRLKRLPWQWSWLYRFSHRRSLLSADAVLTYRPHTARILLGMGVPVDRLHIVPPAAEVREELLPQTEARSRLGLPSEASIILCVSRFTVDRSDGKPGKTGMILDLLDAFSAIPAAAILVIVGDGPGRGQVHEVVHRAGLDERVVLAGRADDEALSNFYAASDLFAYPYSLDRPWIAVLEAQMAGLPVVAMDTDSNRLTVEDGRTGLLARDLEEFRAQLIRLAGDRRQCAVMGEAAREYAERSHSINVRVRHLDDLLKRAGASSGRTSIASSNPAV